MSVDKIVLDRIILDREGVRAEFNDHLSEFSSDDRKKAECLGAISVSTDDFLNIFDTIFLPDMIKLEKKRTDKTLRNYLMKQLSFDSLGAEMAAVNLVDTRRQEVILATVNQICTDKNKQTAIADLLGGNSIDDLERLIIRFVNYRKALEIQTECNLPLYDDWASWTRRNKMLRAIKKDQKRTIKTENRTLVRNAKLVQKMLTENSLLARVIQHKLSYIEILGLRQDYQKAVEKLKEDDQLNPEKLLEVFDVITANYIKKEAPKQATKNLKELNNVGQELRALILEIFDLDNTQRNQLMMEMNTYANLAHESSNIAVARQNREKILAS